MPLLRISQHRVFLEFIALRHLEKQKASPVQFAVSKPNCKCLLQQQPCCAVATNMLQEDCRLERAPVGRPSLDLPLLPGDRMHTHVAGA